ncbi:MAG: GNAT family N-acetyltransferase [Opitutales bacterium]
MQAVTLRPVTKANYTECVKLKVAETQRTFVATNLKSLADAYIYDNMHPLAIYQAKERGQEKPSTPMVGFTMYEVTDGVGFILRLMIDARFQRQGFGRATMVEVIRRLRLHPGVELIGTSHMPANTEAAQLYASMGFVAWEPPDWAQTDPEVCLQLPL